MARSPSQTAPPLCFSDCLLCLCAGRRYAGCAASARRPGGGDVARGDPYLLLLFVVRPGGGACAARHADTRSGNLDRQCCSFRAGADAHAADAAIPRRNPMAPADDLFGIQKTSVARSEEHTSELQSPSVSSYAVFC